MAPRTFRPARSVQLLRSALGQTQRSRVASHQLAAICPFRRRFWPRFERFREPKTYALSCWPGYSAEYDQRRESEEYSQRRHGQRAFGPREPEAAEQAFREPRGEYVGRVGRAG
jgi:hypothetical protein